MSTSSLFRHANLSVCLSVCLSVSLYVYLSVCLSVSLYTSDYACAQSQPSSNPFSSTFSPQPSTPKTQKPAIGLCLDRIYKHLLPDLCGKSPRSSEAASSRARPRELLGPLLGSCAKNDDTVDVWRRPHPGGETAWDGRRGRRSRRR